MIAELVTTVAWLALSPSVAAESASLSSSASRFSRISRNAAPVGDQLREAGLVDGAEPDQALDVEREAGVERLQPPLGPELEERVGLEARLLGLARTGRRRRRPPCGRASARSGRSRTRRSAPPTRPASPPAAPFSSVVGDRLDLVGVGDVVGRAGRPVDERAELVEPRLRLGGARGVALGELRRSRSASAARAPSRNATASWISKSLVTRPSLTPRPYSTGTSATNCSSCWARRAASSSVSGAAVKPAARRRPPSRVAGQAGERLARARASPSAPRSSA